MKRDKKTIVVVGGTSGIGRASAKSLVMAGHNVVIGGRRASEIRGDLGYFEATGGHLEFIDIDVNSQVSVSRFFNSILNTDGEIDTLVYCAGVMKLSPLQELKIVEWEEMINTNVLGLLRCLRDCLPLLNRVVGAKVIIVGSVAGHKVATPDGTVYSATKFAVAALSEGMRQELAELNVSVTLVSPGATKTQLGQDSSNRESKDRISDYYAKYGMEVDDVARQIAEIAVSDSTANVSEIVLRSLHHRF